jgi:uncharacterized protein with GYD domain
MPKFLAQGTYTFEGIQGLVNQGGTARRAAVEKAVTGLGGKLEAFYFALGETDIYAIVEVPDNVTAAALSLGIATSGLGGIKSSLLLTAEEIDQAAGKAQKYT